MVAESLPSFEAPVLTNPESPVSYPIDLFEQRVEGTVVLRLYIDERGSVVPESTRIAEGSGYSPLDSAALHGVPAMRFAPARRSGRPVPATFLQPIHFRRPERER
jgi:TonB family protein